MRDLTPTELRLVKKAVRDAYEKGRRAERREFDAFLSRMRALKELNGSADSFLKAYSPGERAKGRAVEMEHTADPAEARRIAEDHLDEDPAYYSKLDAAGLADGKDADNPHDLVAEAMLAHAEESLATGADPLPGLDRLRDLLDDPAALADLLGGAGADDATIGKCFRVLKAWDESKHPRGKGGHFIGKERIEAAKTDPKLAKELRKEVKPEDAGKLDAALEGKTDLGRTKRGQAKHEAAGRRATKDEAKAKTQEFLKHFQKVGDLKAELTADHLYDLAEHLKSEHVTVDDVRQLRTALHGAGGGKASFGGQRKRQALVDALRDHARGRGLKERAKELGLDGGELSGAVGTRDAGEPAPAAGERAAPATTGQYGAWGRAAAGEGAPTAAPAEDVVAQQVEKQPHEMTRAELKKQRPDVWAKIKSRFPGSDTHSYTEYLRAAHSRGLDVPLNLRSQYVPGSLTSEDKTELNKGRKTTSEVTPHRVSRTEYLNHLPNGDYKPHAELWDRIVADPKSMSLARSMAGRGSVLQTDEDAAVAMGFPKEATPMLLAAGLQDRRHREAVASEINRGNRASDAALSEYPELKEKQDWYEENATTYWDGNSRRAAVATSLTAGKPVPPEVLADYPDLAPAAPPAATPPAPAELPPQGAATPPAPATGVAADEAELAALNRTPAKKLTPAQRKRKDQLSREFTARKFPGATPVMTGGGKGPGVSDAENESTAAKPTPPATTVDTPAGADYSSGTPAPGTGGTSGGAKMETYVVGGDTYANKDAIRAAGGKWDGERKVWTVPEGASLPTGLTVTPQSELDAMHEPGRGRVGGQVVRGNTVHTLRAAKSGTVQSPAGPATVHMELLRGHPSAGHEEAAAKYPDREQYFDNVLPHAVAVHSVNPKTGQPVSQTKTFPTAAAAREFFDKGSARIQGGGDSPPAPGGTQGGEA